MREVIVYSSNGCGGCILLKEYLTSRGIGYVEKNISEDKEARKELMQKGHMSVPVLSVEGQELVGFDKAKLDSIFEEKGCFT